MDSKQKKVTKDFKQKKITREINDVLSKDFEIDTSADGEILRDKDFSWDDLNKLKEELGQSVIQFVAQVNRIITNPEIVNNLGDKRDHFNKVVALFFNDINNFSNKIRELREQHENRSGPVKDINEFNIYNRIAISYHSLFVELTTLVTPTLSDIMLTVSEVTNSTVIDQPVN